jgi:hypothetical protein
MSTRCKGTCEKKADCHDIHVCGGGYCSSGEFIPFETKTFPDCVKCTGLVVRCYLCNMRCSTGNELRSKKCAKCTNKEKRVVKMERKMEKKKNTLCNRKYYCGDDKCMYKHNCARCGIDIPQGKLQLCFGQRFCEEHLADRWNLFFPKSPQRVEREERCAGCFRNNINTSKIHGKCDCMDKLYCVDCIDFRERNCNGMCHYCKEAIIMAD